MAQIQFEDVCKTYQMGAVAIKAVDDANFTIESGELAVILGASGAGKTTILNLLAGMDAPTSGRIVVDGQDITALTNRQLTTYRREQVGFIFQFYNLITNLNALENVQFAAQANRDHLDAGHIMDEVGLGERRANFPSQLSGGEQQRVAIARAVAKNPALLLCDEPTGALDYATGKQVLRLLVDINQRYHKTVVIVTHNQALAGLADRVIRVRSGRIESVVAGQTRALVEQIEW